MSSPYSPLAKLDSVEKFQTYLHRFQVDLPFEATVEHGETATLNQPVTVQGHTVGNRFCVLPLEGWDSTADGFPTESTRERWRRFGQCGAKLLWTESAAVRKDGCSSPSQLIVNEQTVAAIAELRLEAVRSHGVHFGQSEDLHIGLQLTHAGRLSLHRADGKRTPFILHHHPFLDPKYEISPDYPLMTDEEIYALIDDFVAAAVLSAQAGFDFIDIKSCHGYFGHEILGAKSRVGDFGGSLENRTRFIREVVRGIRRQAPDLQIGVRASVFDTVPYQAGPDGVGEPLPYDAYPYALGVEETGQALDLSEPIALLQMLRDLDVQLVCLSGASPYKNWHIQKPQRIAGPGDYETPEEPLLGVARHIAVTGALKQACPELTIVGSSYSYLQQWLPNVAQAVVRQGLADVVGLGRMLLVYPEFPTDVLRGRPLQLEKIAQRFPSE